MKTKIISLALYEPEIAELDALVDYLQGLAIGPAKVNRSTAFRKLLEVYRSHKK
jgi:hypothetical protein